MAGIREFPHEPISDERLVEVRRDLAKASVPEQLALYPAGVMLSLIARLDVAEAAAAQRIRELEAALAASISDMADWARKAGEAEGRLKASEMAGIVEGWRERALKAEAALAAETERCARIADVEAEVCGGDYGKGLPKYSATEIAAAIRAGAPR